MQRRQAVASLTAILVAGPAVAPGVGPASPARAATPIDWPTYRGDASRSGVSPGSGTARDPTELWKVTTTSNIGFSLRSSAASSTSAAIMASCMRSTP